MIGGFSTLKKRGYNPFGFGLYPELRFGSGFGEVSPTKKVIFENQNKGFDEGIFNQGSGFDDSSTLKKLGFDLKKRGYKQHYFRLGKRTLALVDPELVFF